MLWDFSSLCTCDWLELWFLKSTSQIIITDFPLWINAPWLIIVNLITMRVAYSWDWVIRWFWIFPIDTCGLFHGAHRSIRQTNWSCFGWRMLCHGLSGLLFGIISWAFILTLSQISTIAEGSCFGLFSLLENAMFIIAFWLVFSW
jgi:hypothetical protein